MVGAVSLETVMRDLARAWAAGEIAPRPLPANVDAEAFLAELVKRPAHATLLPRISDEGLPSPTAELLSRQRHQLARRTAAMLLELERLLPALEAEGARPIVLKGGALAVTCYARPEHRWFLDLDILVVPEAVDAVTSRLQSLGFAPASGVAPFAMYDRHHFHRILRNARGLSIEVHWAVTLPRSAYTFDLAALRADATEVPLGATTMRVPSVRDQILHGVSQSIYGRFGDLRRILDLHLLEAELPAGGHDEIIALAQRHNFAVGLWLQYRLREQILGAPIPAAVQTSCRPEPRLRHVLENLDLTNGCLGARRPRDGDLDQLIHWLCVPPRRRWREIGCFLWPDGAGLMPYQWSWGGAPLWRRLWLAVRRVPGLLRMLNWWLAARAR